jgi:hypothetical protein
MFFRRFEDSQIKQLAPRQAKIVDSLDDFVQCRPIPSNWNAQPRDGRNYQPANQLKFQSSQLSGMWCVYCIEIIGFTLQKHLVRLNRAR